MTCTPMSAAISIIRFQFDTANLRSSSVGPDQRYTTIKDEISTPVSLSAFSVLLFALSCKKEGAYKRDLSSDGVTVQYTGIPQSAT